MRVIRIVILDGASDDADDRIRESAFNLITSRFGAPRSADALQYFPSTNQRLWVMCDGARAVATVSAQLLAPDAQDYRTVAGLVSHDFGPWLGFLDDLVVAPDHEGHGLATDLITTAVLELERDARTDWIAGAAWKLGERVPVAGILRRLLFTYRGEIAEYWSSSSVDPQRGWLCPRCGDRCLCAAQFFADEIGELVKRWRSRTALHEEA